MWGKLRRRKKREKWGFFKLFMVGFKNYYFPTLRLTLIYQLFNFLSGLNLMETSLSLKVKLTGFAKFSCPFWSYPIYTNPLLHI